MFCAHLLTLKTGDLAPSKNFKEITQETDKFYRKPINQSLKIWSGQDVDGWSILVFQFFSDSVTRSVACAFKKDTSAIEYLDKFKTGFKEDWKPIDAALGKSVGCLGEFDKPAIRSKLVWLRGGIEDQVSTASYFLRYSNSLRIDSFSQVNQSNFTSDAKGVALVDTSAESDKRCINLLSVLALSCAYQAVLNDAIDSLASVGNKTGGKAGHEIRRWSAFLASYYFIEPVRTTTIELIDFYQSIQKRQRINIQYQEVTEQLKIVAELAHIERAEKQASSVFRWSSSLAFIGLLITIASVPQCTPKAWQDFGASWNCTFSAQGCVNHASNTEIRSPQKETQQLKKTIKKEQK